MVVASGEDEVAAWPLVGVGDADVDVVDALARAQLAAKRLGCSIRLRDACPELLDLLNLCGLAVELCGAVEVGGEAEGGEEVGVEEVVVTDDPVA